MYSNKIFEIFKNPSCAGGLQGANGIGKYIDDNCGDFVKIYLKVDENQIITEARFKTMGSVGTIVASSVLCQQIADLSLAEAQNISAEDILEVTGEYPTDKMYSLDFVIRALNLAIADYFQRIEKEEKPKRKKSEKVSKYVVREENQSELDENEIKMLQKTKQENTAELSVNVNDVNNDDFEEEYDFDNFDDEEALFIPDEQPNSAVDKQQYIKHQKQDDTLESEENEEEEISPADMFLRSSDEDAEELAVHSLANRDKISITTVLDEEEHERAKKMVEEARKYTPYVETKIIRDEDMKNSDTLKKEENDQGGDKQVSKAKALFDAMFEE